MNEETKYPPLPEGYVYLGLGGTFKRPGNTSFPGLWFNPDVHRGWKKGYSLSGLFYKQHYAAPIDSEIARLNMDKQYDHPFKINDDGSIYVKGTDRISRKDVRTMIATWRRLLSREVTSHVGHCPAPFNIYAKADFSVFHNFQIGCIDLTRTEIEDFIEDYESRDFDRKRDPYVTNGIRIQHKGTDKVFRITQAPTEKENWFMVREPDYVVILQLITATSERPRLSQFLGGSIDDYWILYH